MCCHGGPQATLTESMWEAAGEGSALRSSETRAPLNVVIRIERPSHTHSDTHGLWLETWLPGEHWKRDKTYLTVAPGSDTYSTANRNPREEPATAKGPSVAQTHTR